MTKPTGDYEPSRRELLRPAEYVGGAAIAALFVGGVALFATRDLMLAAIGTGGVFIIVLMVLALIAMTFKPDAAETAELEGAADAAAKADATGEHPVAGETPDASGPDSAGTDRPDAPTRH
ncbi:hypothetical protein BJ978_001060 [Agromyces terreus]|uniref:Uncharacterized protein n=1 Tax=Agromyces terreus TaxID=424795 RepID=A0A9X2H5H6_9MICO|nr:hypothetical protein [Agromyces terreus]MCP2370384.1 hypothetical protein [Agromyces terreus]